MAGPDVFLDTSGFYALVDRRDGHHAAAAQAAARVARAGRRLLVTDYVVCESVNLANARGGSRLGARVLELLEQSVALRLEWIGEARFTATGAFFRKHADHGYSFTDCTSFVVMAELELREALTSDRHFLEAGFAALLK